MKKYSHFKNVVSKLKQKDINRVIIVRHGESIWNHDSKFTGWSNIPLTSNGRKEAKQIAYTLRKENIQPTVFFSSVLSRSIDTCNIIKRSLKKSGPTFTSWRLNEKHYGSLEGVRREKIRDEYGEKFTNMMRNNFYMKPPVVANLHPDAHKYSIYKNCYYNSIKNGESKENVLDRILPYFENDILCQHSENHTPLVVTHKHCLRVLLKHYLDINDEDFESFQIPDNVIIDMHFDSKGKFIMNHMLNISR
jgi:2,3-bisphosphoglycerate-dependent phosphoglycerate mutase